MKINEHWLSVLPNMIYHCRMNSVKVPEFEELIIQDANSASDYARNVLHTRWPEAESIILTNASASYSYASAIIGKRWEEAEDIISTDAQSSYQYAKFVLRSRFEKGEPAIATSSNLSMHYARDILKGRFIEGETTIAAEERKTGNSATSKAYYEMVIRDPDDWAGWTEDQLKHSPCWMYMYAKQFSKGRLPDFLHNIMTVFAMTIPDNYYVKRYFKAKKYNKKIKRRKKPEGVENNG
jgi:hypothetical protein